jgi:regulator of RNase E activity RraA
MSAYNTAGTAAVSDALDRMGLPGSLPGIATLASGQRASGPAFTARYEPRDARGGTVGDFLDDVPAGAVLLIDNGGRTDCTVWGGIMTPLAASRQVAAWVINGACRDTAVAAQLGYPIWSAGRFMRTGKDRVRLAELGATVTIDGVPVSPGDLVIGDEDGVVAVPADRAEQVLVLARKIEAAEDSIVADIQAGSLLKDARARHGYHTLQTRSSQ